MKGDVWQSDMMIYELVRKIDATIDIDLVNDNKRFYPIYEFLQIGRNR